MPDVDSSKGTNETVFRAPQVKLRLWFVCFAVTEKVWETDSTDASDGESQRINPTEKEKQPSPAKKIIKKTCADVKNKAARQSSLTSFFKKSWIKTFGTCLVPVESVKSTLTK